jgi:hypothetical protein
MDPLRKEPKLEDEITHGGVFITQSLVIKILFGVIILIVGGYGSAGLIGWKSSNTLNSINANIVSLSRDIDDINENMAVRREIRDEQNGTQDNDIKLLQGRAKIVEDKVRDLEENSRKIVEKLDDILEKLDETGGSK